MNTFTFVTRGPSPQKTEQTRARILAAAAQLFEERGVDGWTMKELAELAECAVGLVYRYFPARDALVLGLYSELARSVYPVARTLPQSTVGARFVELVKHKLAELDLRPNVFRSLARAALSPDAATGVLHDQTAHIRKLGIEAFTLVVSGASNAPADSAAFGRLLYGAHLLLVLLWTQRPSAKASVEQLSQELAPVIDLAVSASSTRLLAPLLKRADAFTRSLLEEEA